MTINNRALLFATLGKLWKASQSDFTEPAEVTDSEVLTSLKSILSKEVGRIDRLYGVTLNDQDVFEGKFDQKISLARSKVFRFEISDDRIYYKPLNSNEIEEYTETDEGYLSIIEFAAKKKRSDMKLNCKPGNYQCGGKCQSDKRGCPSQMSPDQRKAYQSALRKARKSKITPEKIESLAEKYLPKEVTVEAEQSAVRTLANLEVKELDDVLLSTRNFLQTTTYNQAPTRKKAGELQRLSERATILQISLGKRDL